MKSVAKQKANRENPLTAMAFITPAIFGRTIDATKLGTFALSVSNSHVQFFEVWSDGTHTELLAVASEAVMHTLKEQITSVFNATATKELKDYETAGKIPLIPPWLHPGVRCVVLVVRETYPFRGLGEFDSANDPAPRIVTALQALGATANMPKVYSWMSFGWTEFDWAPYARQYTRLLAVQDFAVGEEYRTTTGGRGGGRLNVNVELAEKSERRAQSPQLLASLRVALFCDDQKALRNAVEIMKGTLNAYGSESNPIAVDELSANELHNMVGRVIVPGARGYNGEEYTKRLLEAYMKDVQRGREAMPVATTFPYLLLTSPELPTFVHLPLWSTPERLISLRWSRAPTPFVERPEMPTETAYPILVGKSLELSEDAPVYIGLEELGIHSLLLGSTGAGKTSLIVNLLLQIAKAMEEGKINSTIWVIDPVGRLGELWITRAAEDAKERTIFFEPERMPWGMNPFALPPTESLREYLMLAKEKTSTVTRMIKEVARLETGQSQWGHRLRRIIRLMIMALYQRGATHPERRFFTFLDLVELAYAIGDEEKLLKIAQEKGLDESIVDALSGYNKEARDSVLHKIERFVEPVIRDFICSDKSINFYELDKPGSIIFFSFKGFMTMPDDVATLMGSVIMSIYSAELARKHKTTWEQATQTYLVIDEFHRTADLLSFRDILATARNIRLTLWLVYQGAGQVEDEALHEEIFNNAHTKFIFRVGGNLAAGLKNDLDIALGRPMAERLQTLENARCYLIRSGSGNRASPIPHLIGTMPFPEEQRSLDQAYVYFTDKMAKYAPPVIESLSVMLTGRSSEHAKAAEASLALAPFAKLNIRLPHPEDYPVIWAIRDFFMQDQATWPTLNDLLDYIAGQPWVFNKYRNRAFVIEAVNRLKAGYVLTDGRTQRLMITQRNDIEGELRRSIVLFNEPKAGGPEGSEYHLKVTMSFLEEQVRLNMPVHLGFMPPHADNVPDGVILSKKDEKQWDQNNLTAVETHLSHHPDRAIEQAKKRFAQGYARVIVVFTRIDDERDVRDPCCKDEELNKRIKEGQLELQTHQPLTAQRPEPAAQVSTQAHETRQLPHSQTEGITMFDVGKETEVLRGKVEKLLRRLGATQITVFHESDSGIVLQCIDLDGKKTFVKYEVRYYKNPIRRVEVADFAKYVQEKRHLGAEGGIYITNATFEPGFDGQIELVDGRQLDELLTHQPR